MVAIWAYQAVIYLGIMLICTAVILRHHWPVMSACGSMETMLINPMFTPMLAGLAIIGGVLSAMSLPPERPVIRLQILWVVAGSALANFVFQMGLGWFWVGVLIGTIGVVGVPAYRAHRAFRGRCNAER